MSGQQSKNQRVMLAARSLMRVRATIIRSLAHEPALRDRIAAHLEEGERAITALLPAVYGGQG